MAFDKSNWAYNDLNTVFQFVKWCETQTDYAVILNECRKLDQNNKFVTKAVIGYLKKREELDAKNS